MFRGYGLSSATDAVAIARIVCGILGNGINESAVKLLVETAQQETKLGSYRDNTPYRAGYGLTQFDRIAFIDVKQRTRTKVARLLYKNLGISLSTVEHRELELSPMLSMVFCRLFYRLIPEPIPKTISGRAAYWKKYYNSDKGKGIAIEYITNAKRIEVSY